MATASGNGGGDRTAEAVVAGQISQAVNSTANLLHLIRQSSSAEALKVQLIQMDHPNDFQKFKLNFKVHPAEPIWII
uniref:Uncharacterized protein n=1 Tax=Brassica oleracea var. oleracea TaxID=109376 RepID=A0A0D3CGR0_BRAOL